MFLARLSLRVPVREQSLVQQLVQQLEPVSPLVRQLQAFEKQPEVQQHLLEFVRQP